MLSVTEIGSSLFGRAVMRISIGTIPFAGTSKAGVVVLRKAIRSERRRYRPGTGGRTSKRPSRLLREREISTPDSSRSTTKPAPIGLPVAPSTTRPVIA